jgi:hypothetical protein
VGRAKRLRDSPGTRAQRINSACVPDADGG